MNEIETNNLESKPTLAELSVSLLDDVKTLLTKQLELFSVEVQEQLSASARLVTTCVVAGFVALFALQLSLMAIVYYLAERRGMPLYGSFALAGVSLFVISMIGAGIALLRLKQKKMNSEAARIFKGQLKWIRKKNN